MPANASIFDRWRIRSSNRLFLQAGNGHSDMPPTVRDVNEMLIGFEATWDCHSVAEPAFRSSLCPSWRLGPYSEWRRGNVASRFQKRNGRKGESSRISFASQPMRAAEARAFRGRREKIPRMTRWSSGVIPFADPLRRCRNFRVRPGIPSAGSSAGP